MRLFVLPATNDRASDNERTWLDLDELRAVVYEGDGAARYHGYSAYSLVLAGAEPLKIQLQSTGHAELMAAWTAPQWDTSS